MFIQRDYRLCEQYILDSPLVTFIYKYLNVFHSYLNAPCDLLPKHHRLTDFTFHVRNKHFLTYITVTKLDKPSQ